MSQTYGQQGPGTGANDFNLWSFLIQQALLKMQTVTLVEVVAVHGGGIAPVGTVDVRPLVNQMTGDRTPVQHGVIYGIPFFRMQGGGNAIVCDPQTGDIGLCAFASRDISAVKSTRAAANPGSFRTFDYADGLYVGGFLNSTPTQYLAFVAGIQLQAPVVSTSGNLSAGTGASGILTDSAGQTATVQNGIIINID